MDHEDAGQDRCHPEIAGQSSRCPLTTHPMSEISAVPLSAQTAYAIPVGSTSSAGDRKQGATT
jgi:hypothetical protein